MGGGTQKSAGAFRGISEVSALLGIGAHVLRFWEQRIGQIAPVKGAGGRRYYRPEDVALLAGLQKLLREDGLTLRGAQRRLAGDGLAAVRALGLAALAARGHAEAALPPPETPAETPAEARAQSPARRRRAPRDEAPELPLFAGLVDSPAPEPVMQDTAAPVTALDDSAAPQADDPAPPLPPESPASLAPRLVAALIGCDAAARQGAVDGAALADLARRLRALTGA